MVFYYNSITTITLLCDNNETIWRWSWYSGGGWRGGNMTAEYHFSLKLYFCISDDLWTAVLDGVF